MGKFLRLMVALATTVSAASPAPAQQGGGSVTGTVVSSSGQQPLAGATVTVAGTQLTAVTGQNGTYRIASVPAGPQSITASFLGYSARTQRVTVAADQPTTVNLTLEPSALELSALVVTATGTEQRKRELGNTVATIRTADVPMAQVEDFSQLLSSRAAGVTVQSNGGTLGGGSRIAIRGLSSISGSSTPLFVIDGIRYDNTTESTGLFTGGEATSRLNDINPEEIETLEILKGPAASALYGTAAANGVVQITTKRGRAGRTQMRGWAQVTTHRYNEDLIPANYYGASLKPDGTFLRRCSYVDRAYFKNCGAGHALMPDTVYKYNPLLDDPNSTLDNGYVHEIGASLSGGSDNGSITYFLSAQREAGDGALPDNTLDRNSFRANVSSQPWSTLRLTASTSFTDSYIELPQNGNSGAGGIFYFALRGNPRPEFVESGGVLASGFRFDELSFWDNEEDTRRFTGSVKAQWTPASWLQVNATAGSDSYDRFERSFAPPVNARGVGFQTGLREQYRVTSTEVSGLLDGTMTHQLGSAVSSSTSAGVSYNASGSNYTFGVAYDITPGVKAGTRPGAIDETGSETRLFGIYARQQLGLNDRLFVTASVRGDQATELGANIGFVTYPSLSASWVLLEEPWFPRPAALSALRVRTAYGESGLRPGRLNALQTYNSQAAAIGTSGAVVPGFILSNAGNPDLSVERVREWEFGGDVGFFDDRVAAELTHYRKNTRDALVRRPLPPSLGGPSAQYFNLGSVSNQGWEATLRTDLLRGERFGLNLGVNFATNRNELLSYGDSTIPPIVIEGAQRYVEGYPLGGYWQPNYTYADTDNDGLIERGEVRLVEEQDDPRSGSSYQGTPYPTRQLSFSADARLFNNFRLGALLDHRSGHKLFNLTRQTRIFGSIGEEVSVPGAMTLEAQAGTLACVEFSACQIYMEDAAFWKLRELSLGWSAPSSMRRVLGGAEALSITVAARNLMTWTDYSGMDPEVNSPGVASFSEDPGRAYVADVFGAPAPRQFTVRVDVTP